MPPHEAEIIPTPDMVEEYSDKFVESYSTALREIIREFGKTSTYEADTLMKVLATTWLSGVERRPMLVSDFSSIRYHGGSQDRNPVYHIESHLSPHIGKLALEHDQDFALYKSLYERFGGTDPTKVNV